jgi:hypothetical protein
MLPVDIFPWVIQSPDVTGSATPRANAVWTSTWSVHGLRFGPHYARRRTIARVISCVQLGRRVAADESCHGTRSERLKAERATPSVRCA